MHKTILIILVLWLFYQPGDSATLSGIRTDVRDLVQDTDTNGFRWSSVTLNSRINSAQNLIAAMSRCVSSATYITTNATNREYLLPADFLMPKRASYLVTGTTFYKVLEPTDRIVLDRIATWEYSTRGVPARYYIDYQVTGSSNFVIGLDPFCTTVSSGVNALRVEYYATVPAMSADSDEPFNSADFLSVYHTAIMWYVAAWCKYDDKLYTEAEMFRKNFIDELQILINNIQSKPGWNPIFPSYK